MTISQIAGFVRATPKKLGEAPRNDNHFRENWHRQLIDQSEKGKISSRHAFRLYDLFWGFSDETAKDCWPSQETLAKRWQCSTRSVQRTIAAGRRAGVLATAQLKGFDPQLSTWFSSSNTHRAKLVAEWVEKLKTSRAAKRDAQRQQRLTAKANPSTSKNRSDESFRPPTPDVDELEYKAVRDLRTPPEEAHRRAQALREALKGKPPPSA